MISSHAILQHYLTHLTSRKAILISKPSKHYLKIILEPISIENQMPSKTYRYTHPIHYRKHIQFNSFQITHQNGDRATIKTFKNPLAEVSFGQL